MARKRIFTNKGKGKEAFWGGQRRTLSFPELEQRPAFSGELSRRLKRILPRSVYDRLSRVKAMHLVLLFVCCGALGFIIWFFGFVYPSPIGGLKPPPGSVTDKGDIDLVASFDRNVKKSELSVAVDGKDVTPKASLDGKKMSCKLALPDGTHRAVLNLKGGGLMGKRTSRWSFAVDTTTPKLTITGKKITDIPNSDRIKVSFSGQAEKGASVTVEGKSLAIDSGGKFKGEATTMRDKSLKISASDQAGNKSNAYVVTQEPIPAKGAHVSVYIASSDFSMGKMVEMVENTELNGLEIDLKDESGQIGFELDNKIAQDVGSLHDYIDLDSLVDRLRYRDIYTICRIVVFKDPILARGKTDLAVQDKYGGLWGKAQWVDPYSKDVWDYNMAVAEAAARAGFNEVQFDYVRFPSDGNTDTCKYPNQDQRGQGQVIDGFLAYARERLAPYNVFISADLFGLTASKQGEMGIGQRLKDVAKRVDYVSPMVYPSHYNPGEYNIKDPEANPYDIVSKSLEDFKKVMKGTQAKLRPWLQDFSLRITYDADMVRRQINAVTEAGIDEWLLWDPDCTYSESALKPAK